jgi:hypothetical protein
MDILKNELFYKFRKMVDPEYKKKDFSFYIHKISTIAPISFELLGNEFFKKTIPLYFKELVIDQKNLVENLYFFPLYLKKYQHKFKNDYPIKDFSVELMDYEFSVFRLAAEPVSTKSTHHIEATHEIFQNPLAQAIRHEFDIHEFVQNFHKKTKDFLPKKIKTLLLLSKNPETNEIVFLKGNIHHAAIIDELHDGKIDKKHLHQILQTQYPGVAQSEWVIAFTDLKKHFFTLES